MADGIEVSLDMTEWERVMREYPGKVNVWMDGLAEDTVTDTKLSMGTSPPGRVYSRGEGRVHVASLPGYPPNVDYAVLINAIEWEPTGRFERTVSVGTEYAEGLEDGTSETAARPFLRPAFDRLRQRIEPDARQNLSLE